MSGASHTTLAEAHAAPPSAIARRADSAARAAVAAVALALGAGLVLQRWLALDSSFVWAILLLAPLGGAALVFLAAHSGAGASFGRANQATLGRGAIAVLLFALLATAASGAVAWLAVLLASLGLALDGVDGWLARRRGEASAFGARFDMETDALLILALAALAWQLGKAGPWILLAGGLRYGYVAAARWLVWMRAQLPPSRRRQTVCVVQIVSLIGCIVPAVPVPSSSVVAAAGLLVLVWSFAIDVAWLARRAGESNQR
jgi:phosphatidylglycerophosphate synthase